LQRVETGNPNDQQTMQGQPRRVNILLAEDPSSFQKRPREWRCLWFERLENLDYVTRISRLNPVRSMRIVNGRFSSRYVVRGFGFCDLNSPDVSRRVIFRRARVMPRALAIRVLIGFIAGLLKNTDAILPIMATNLFQRLLELSALVLPLNVCPLTSQLMSNLDIRFCVRDEWKIAAADHHNNHDYG
jgi:hypothetical protein